MSNPDSCSPLTRAEIDLRNLAHNCRELRRLTSPSARLMSVVKADAYGHGLVPVSRVVMESGADWLAVTLIPEALLLRQAGLTSPILLLGYTPPHQARCLAECDLRASINSLEVASRLSQEASRCGGTIKVHLKVDTGMGRLGLLADTLRVPGRSKGEVSRVAAQILEIARMPGLHVEGIYTHFASADRRDKRHAQEQFELFLDILSGLKKHSLEFEIRHAANSAATIEMPETHLDMVRPGIALYGLWPSEETDRGLIDLRPVMSLQSRVIQVKEVPAGFTVSYGSTWESPCRTRIATIPIGYADGFRRQLSSNGHVLVRGRRVPVVGRVCMDLTMIDVGDLDLDLEEEVVLLGAQGGETITAEEIAQRVGTINYEIVSALTARIPRTYKN